jgi:hypothetical protein
MEASEKLNRSIDSAKQYKMMLEELGFIDIVEAKYKWPQNRWPKDKKFKELGELSPTFHTFFFFKKKKKKRRFHRACSDSRYHSDLYLGMWTLENTTTGLQGLSLALFTRALGWTPEELEAFWQMSGTT